MFNREFNMTDALPSRAASGILEQGLQTALHELALDVMLVDVEGTLLYANRSAHCELALGVTLTLNGGRLTAGSEA
jgi:hypothetical protein